MSDKMKERVKKGLESLDEAERAQADVLDAYFMFRTNMPGDDPGFGKAIEEPKTTEEIMDDLSPMMPLSQKVVVGYMRSHEFGMTTVGDGTVRWAIWRFLNSTVLI